MNKNLKIAVAGTSYVGLSIATLLSQHHEVWAVDIIPEKVDLINRRKSPIQDEYIEKYLAEKPLNALPAAKRWGKPTPRNPSRNVSRAVLSQERPKSAREFLCGLIWKTTSRPSSQRAMRSGRSSTT